MLLTSHGNLIEVNKLNEYHIKGLLLNTESNLHPEFFDPWYYYRNSKIYTYKSKYRYIIYFNRPFKTPLNYRVDSVFFFHVTSSNNILDIHYSIRYARIVYKAFYSTSQAY